MTEIDTDLVASIREKILQIHTKGKPIKEDVDLDKIVEMTEGYSGACILSCRHCNISYCIITFRISISSRSIKTNFRITRQGAGTR
jgi:ATP-dependent 26S proteasome regulatory subunit